MKKIFALLFTIYPFIGFSQSTQPIGTAITNLDITNINPTILTGGDMFHDLTFSGSNANFLPGFEVPRGSGIHSIFAGALWIGGRDSQNNVYVSAQTYRSGDEGYWPGPISNVHNQAHSTKYDKIWKVSKAEIDNHKINFNQPTYQLPTSIATWPGNGNIANGEAAKLAPFIDLNNDGIYNPTQGDYPDIKGDQALYFILNDNGIKDPFSGVMNAEVHVMYYGSSNPAGGPIFNSLFSEYRIINRGTINLTNFYAGLWMEFNLGNFYDDYVGCDTTTNRFFVYNGDNNDKDSTYFAWNTSTRFMKGYGLNPPVQSVSFLDQKLSHFVYYDDNQNATTGNPMTHGQFYNYLKGYWKDSSLITYGGDGTNQANPPTNYMFPGDPISGTGWSERNNLASTGVNIPGDRRGIGSIGPFNLNAGQELKFTVAYTYSRGTSNLNSVAVAQQDAIAVQNFFRNQVMSTPEPATVKNELLLFPNPAQENLNIQIPASFMGKQVSITIADYTGRTILQQQIKPETNSENLGIAKLSKGVYLVTVKNEKQVLTSKFVKL